MSEVGGIDEPLPYPVDRVALNVLAHPLRARLLAELRVMDEASATDLARILDTNSGATSYHLRRLAEAGLVRDTGTGTGRRRLWTAHTEDRPLDIDDPDASDEASLDWLARDYVAHFAGKAQGWIDVRPEFALEWQEVCGLDDAAVLVTDEQLSALRAQVADLVGRYRRVGAGNPQAKRVAFWTCALPVDPPRRRP